MPKEGYIRDLDPQDRNDLFKALATIKDKFHTYQNSHCSNSLIETVGNCTIELSFVYDTTRIYFNAVGISNNHLVNHVEIMSKEEGWKNYLQKLKDHDRTDLFTALAILQGDFHMYRGTSPSHHPPFLLKNVGKCRAKLNFREGVTEISFNSKTISNVELDEWIAPRQIDNE
jgi:hypothetical protein